MTKLTDKMAGLRKKSIHWANTTQEEKNQLLALFDVHNQAIDQCIALAKAEAALLEIRRKLGK